MRWVLTLDPNLERTTWECALTHAPVFSGAYEVIFVGSPVVWFAYFDSLGCAWFCAAGSPDGAEGMAATGHPMSEQLLNLMKFRGLASLPVY